MRPIAVLRPEPGNRVTAAAIEARGRKAIRLPLFEVAPVAWDPPDPTDFDALLLTSSNSLRHGGPGLAALRDLPVHAVGEATASAARRAGFTVAAVGDAGSAALLAQAEAAGVTHALHLGARERYLDEAGIVARAITVYASEPRAIAPAQAARLAGSVALVQSPRAGARLAEVAGSAGVARGSIALVAVSRAAADAAGAGWERVVLAPSVASEALVETALQLTD